MPTYPSGIAPPAVASGYVRELFDDFLTTSLDTSKWYDGGTGTFYNGESGGTATGYFIEGHGVLEGDSMLRLQAYPDPTHIVNCFEYDASIAASVSNWGGAGTSSKIAIGPGSVTRVCFKFDVYPGIAPMAIFFGPTTEFDFAEINEINTKGQAITAMNASIHWSNHTTQFGITMTDPGGVDFSQWGVFEADWTTSQLIIRHSTDGITFTQIGSFTFTSAQLAGGVLAPQNLCLQIQTGDVMPNPGPDASVTSATPVTMYVDWATVDVSSYPSGFSPPPVPSGMTLQLFEDFLGTSLSALGYEAGSGVNAEGAVWHTSHVTVANSVASINAWQDTSVVNTEGITSANLTAVNNWVAGQFGINPTPSIGTAARTRILFTLRADSMPGMTALALCTALANWPPEIDIVEINAPMTLNAATLHYGSGPPSPPGFYPYYQVACDVTQWAIWGVEWDADNINFLLQTSPSGPLEVWATAVNPDPGNSHGFSQAEYLAFQYQTNDSIYSSGTPNFPSNQPSITSTSPLTQQMDWVQISTAPMAQPSGFYPPPVPAGMTRVMFDDFLGTSLGPDWSGKYDGVSGGDADGIFEASHLVLHGDSIMNLQMYQDPVANAANGNLYAGLATAVDNWAGAGVNTSTSAHPGWAVGSRILVCVRADSLAGATPISLLFGAVGWPPEIDFLEINAPLTSETATAIYGSSSGPRQQVQVASPTFDMTKWMIFGVQFTASTIQYIYQTSPTAPLTVWKTIPNPDNNLSDPGNLAQPMWGALQFQTGDPGLPANSPSITASNPIQMQVDWYMVDSPTTGGFVAPTLVTASASDTAHSVSTVADHQGKQHGRTVDNAISTSVAIEKVKTGRTVATVSLNVDTITNTRKHFHVADGSVNTDTAAARSTKVFADAAENSVNGDAITLHELRTRTVASTSLNTDVAKGELFDRTTHDNSVNGDAARTITQPAYGTENSHNTDVATRSGPLFPSAANSSANTDSASRLTPYARTLTSVSNNTDAAHVNSVVHTRSAASVSLNTDSAGIHHATKAVANTSLNTDAVGTHAEVQHRTATTASTNTDSAVPPTHYARSGSEISHNTDAATRHLHTHATANDSAVNIDPPIATLVFHRTTFDTSFNVISGSRSTPLDRAIAVTSLNSDAVTHARGVMRRTGSESSTNTSTATVRSSPIARGTDTSLSHSIANTFGRFAPTVSNASLSVDTAGAKNRSHRAANDAAHNTDVAIHRLAFTRTSSSSSNSQDTVHRTEISHRTTADASLNADSLGRQPTHMTRSVGDPSYNADTAHSHMVEIRTVSTTSANTDTAHVHARLHGVVASFSTSSDSAITHSLRQRHASDASANVDATHLRKSLARAVANTSHNTDVVKTLTRLVRLLEDVSHNTDGVQRITVVPRSTHDQSHNTDHSDRRWNGGRLTFDVSASDTSPVMVEKTHLAFASDISVNGDTALRLRLFHAAEREPIRARDQTFITYEEPNR